MPVKMEIHLSALFTARIYIYPVMFARIIRAINSQIRIANETQIDLEMKNLQSRILCARITLNIII